MRCHNLFRPFSRQEKKRENEIVMDCNINFNQADAAPTELFVERKLNKRLAVTLTFK